MEYKDIAAFSGGKDSTAMVLQLRPKFLFFTATGNELPPVYAHIECVADIVGASVIRAPAPSLGGLIEHFNALPNPRMRWCTRMIKIRPAIMWMQLNPGYRLAVGLRDDEPMRDGIYGLPGDRYWMPMKDWGWDIECVESCLTHYGVTVPERTDCAVCPYQRLGEWWRLWKNWPEEWAQGEAWERQVGHTFRSPSRDTWPASMHGLAERFRNGDVPRGVNGKPGKRCRVCTL